MRESALQANPMDKPRSPRTILLFERELNVLRRAAEGGNELAPAAALFFCAQYKVDVPAWLAISAAGGYCEQLHPRKPKKRGRAAGPLERYHQDMVDFIRWDTIKSTREMQKNAPDELEGLKEDAVRSDRFIEQRRKLLLWYGRDWLRAYECASMILRDTPAFGGPDAMKASYCRVEREPHAWRYYLFHQEFLESVGLEHPCRWYPSRKIVPLYDLTL